MVFVDGVTNGRMIISCQLLGTYTLNFFLKMCQSWAHKYKTWIPTCKVNKKQFLGNAEPLNRKGENLDLDN